MLAEALLEMAHTHHHISLAVKTDVGGSPVTD